MTKEAKDHGSFIPHKSESPPRGFCVTGKLGLGQNTRVRSLLAGENLLSRARRIEPFRTICLRKALSPAAIV
jgi:hypothetical protein